jgi:hypothetical protein
MLRVFLNDALQLAYYWPIDLKSELQLDSGRFFMGITGATGLTGQRQVITNWSLRRVVPSSRNSFAAMIQPSRDVESGKEFEVGGCKCRKANAESSRFMLNKLQVDSSLNTDLVRMLPW